MKTSKSPNAIAAIISDCHTHLVLSGVPSRGNGNGDRPHKLSINLMMQCGIMFRGGKLVLGNFEACLKILRTDIDSGVLKIS